MTAIRLYPITQRTDHRAHYDRAAHAKVGSRPNVYRLEVLALREILADDSTDPVEVAHRDWLKRRLDEESRFVASIPAKLDTRRR